MLKRLQAEGAIRRIAAVPNHYRLGYRYNGMTVWDVHDADMPRLGALIGAQPFVSQLVDARAEGLALQPVCHGPRSQQRKSTATANTCATYWAMPVWPTKLQEQPHPEKPVCVCHLRRAEHADLPSCMLRISQTALRALAGQAPAPRTSPPGSNRRP